jgi:catechol 2,3-dioxygenase-like lactoylglutathione lyase family enzyme
LIEPKPAPATPSRVTRSMLSHVSLGTNDAARAAAFYDPVLAVLGLRNICERDGSVD